MRPIPGRQAPAQPAPQPTAPRLQNVQRPVPSTGNPSAQGNNTREVFLKKLLICSQVLDFNDESRNVNEKKERLRVLQELSETIASPQQMTNLIIPSLEAVINMIKRNIFRPLPIVKKQGVAGETGMDDDEVIVDPSWPHLQPVYEFFLQLIINESVDMKSLRSFISHKFIQEFLELFDSEEPKEREYLKNILHRLYAKLVPRRKMIRKAITDNFNTLIHETYKFNGTSELLDILASVISGFAVPLREEHVIFFHNIIIPLHKVQTCHKFHNELLRCSMLFLSKEPALAFPLISGLLKYWPFANYTKEVLFLAELLDILEVCCDPQKLEPILPKIFKRIIKCISSPHLQVSDRSMCFFENEFFLNILKNYKHIAFPILVPVITHLVNYHWHKLILESLTALRNIIREADPTLFERYANDTESPYLYLVKDPKTLAADRTVAEKKWAALAEKAAEGSSTFQMPVVPYTDSHIVGKFNGVNNGSVLYVD
jgi:serine/threonine-protein phosphatase 2A regulatory subunit B'